MDVSWTDERVERLKKLWSDGLSASQIAGLLGGVTRNAVIGKVHRLGLSGRAKSPAPAAASLGVPRAMAATPRKPAAATVTAPARMAPSAAPSAAPSSSPMMRGNTVLAPRVDIGAMPAPAVIQPPPAPDDVVIPFSERATIMDLREGMCRWPMGDPTSAEFRFCGARCGVGTPYCGHHARIAYQPAADRRRDRSRVVIR